MSFFSSNYVHAITLVALYSLTVLPQPVGSKPVGPKLAGPKLATPQLATPQLATPQLATPQLATPQLATPQLGSPPGTMPHGTLVTPISRVYRVYQSNPQSPNFPLAASAVAIDGTQSYYNWNELSRNIPQAVTAGLPAGFDYSPWIPDGQLASAGRVDPTSTVYPFTFAGLDQPSADWPNTPVTAGETIPVSFYATAPHNPSVWDVWMTTPDWDPATPLNWAQMEFLGRPSVTFTGTHYDFNLAIPNDRTGHHVLWVAWQRDDPVGEVFISTSDILVSPANDVCTAATAVGIGSQGPFDLADATPTTPTATCASASDPDLWFRFTATCSGNLRVDTCGTVAPSNAAISIWSGTCGTLTELDCDSSGCGGTPGAATASVTAGNDYLIKVAASIGATSTFDLRVSYDNSTGSFATTTAGCGTATLQANGAPNLGGIVNYSVQGGTGAIQATALGFTATAIPACATCTVGTPSDALMPGTFSFVIPCDQALIGVQWWLQGIDAFGSSGGCNLGGGVDFTLTDTVRTQVGS